ncbi:MAG: Rho termination factor N-terminal domain-containing protein, partial [Rhodanobacter sp.]
MSDTDNQTPPDSKGADPRPVAEGKPEPRARAPRRSAAAKAAASADKATASDKAAEKPSAPSPAPAPAPAPAAPAPAPAPAVAATPARNEPTSSPPSQGANDSSASGSPGDSSAGSNGNSSQNAPQGQGPNQGQNGGREGREGRESRGRRRRNERGERNNQPRPQGERHPRPNPNGLPVDDDNADPGSNDRVINLTELKRMKAPQLLEFAESLGVHEGIARARKQDVIFNVLKAHARSGGGIWAEGVLEILQDGFGFMRSADESYLAGPDDIYVSPSQIRRFNLRTGDYITGRVRHPKEGERYFAMLRVETINGDPPEASKNKMLFENLTPLFPRKAFKLERGNGSSEDITGRILDLIAPIGKG